MAKVGELFIALSANTTALTKDLKRATSITQKSAKAMTDAFKIVGVAIAAVVTSLAVLTKKSIDAADNFAKLSEKTGISTEALSKLEFAANQSGINLETLSQRMVNLARRAKEGDRGVLSYKQAFDKLGISLRDSRGQLKGTEELLLDVADSFSKMENGTLKAALATDIFSNQGVALIPFLNQGREGIKALTDQAERLGLVIDSKTAKAAEKFNDSLDSLKFAVVGVGRGIAADLLPQLNRLTDSAVDFATQGEGAKRLAEQIAAAFKSVAAAGLVAAFAFNKLQQVIETVTGNERTKAAQLVARAQQQLLNVEQEIFLQERALHFKREEDFEQAVENLKELRRKLQQVQADLEGKKLFAGLVGPPSFDPLFASVESLEQLGEQIGKVFSDMGADVEGSLGRVKTSVGGVNEALAELIEKNKELSQHVLKPIEFSFENLKLNSELLAEQIAKQNQEVLEATELLSGLGIQLGDTAKQTSLAMKAGQQLTNRLSSGFANLITSGSRFSDVLSNLAKQLASMLLQIVLLNTLKKAFGGIGIFGFEHGGRPPVGRPSLVGEAGPELFVPDRSGTIIANDAIQSVARGGGKTVTVINNYDFRGAGPGVAGEARRAIRLMEERILRIARAQATEAVLRSA